jgi:hypothetical protein
MKFLRYYFIVVFFFLTFSEINSQVTDSIVPKINNPKRILRKIDIRSITQSGFNFWNDRFSGHWAGIHYGFNGFSNKDYSGYDTEFMKNDLLRSNSIIVNPVQQSIALQINKNTIGLITGMGLQFQNYRLDRYMSVQKDVSGKVQPKPLISFDANQKSKFAVVYITLPLLAEIQIPVKNYQTRFYFSAGVYTGMRIHSYTNIKYRTDGKREKLKTPDEYSLNKFKYGLMIRTGYRGVNFFTTYDLVRMFKKDKGPELTTYTFGLTLVSF